jgi:threonyl-tRNA synthetase
VRVLPITDRSIAWANEVRDALAAASLRVKVDARGEKIGAKIREAQLDKIPWMLVVGDREAAARSVAVRSRRGGDQGAVTLESFLEQARTVVERRTSEP